MLFFYFKSRLQTSNPIYIGPQLRHGSVNIKSVNGPEVLVVIPTRDRADLLKECINSIVTNTSYKKFSIVVIDNQSTEPSALSYFDELKLLGIQVLKYEDKFNFSSMMNMAFKGSKQPLVCFLNNDTTVINSDWLHNMISHLNNKSVGVVGALLRYPNNKIQHAGVVLGTKGFATHYQAGLSYSEVKTENVPCLRVEAVTFACALVRRECFDEISGMDASFPVGLNDIDFCIRAREANWLVELCVQTNVVHLESRSRGSSSSVKALLPNMFAIMRFSSKFRIGDLQDRYFRKG